MKFAELIERGLVEHFRKIKREIRETLASGWSPPPEVINYLKGYSPPGGKDIEEWFGQLHQWFVRKVEFPESWTETHKTVFLADLLFFGGKNTMKEE